ECTSWLGPGVDRRSDCGASLNPRGTHEVKYSTGYDRSFCFPTPGVADRGTPDRNESTGVNHGRRVSSCHWPPTLNFWIRWLKESTRYKYPRLSIARPGGA